MSDARILIAQPVEAMAPTAMALKGYDLVPTTTLLQAKRMVIEDGIDIFVIGIHFDDSRSLEFVHEIRSCEKNAKTPIIMVRTMPSAIEHTLRKSVLAVKSLYDIAIYLECESEEKLEHELRVQVEKLLHSQESTIDMHSSSITEQIR
ncbi:MAG: hypothetical protein C0507_09860 [Cyanobacteria bacterium PR.3.49]|nr:hypothetical protein [Cyanobacteria bacterium PR.3.49]